MLCLPSPQSGGHFHAPRAAGKFTPGLPKASAGYFRRLNSPTPTLHMGESFEAVPTETGGTPIQTPKSRPTIPSPEAGGGEHDSLNHPPSSLPNYLNVVFTIDHGDGWEFVMKNATKTFSPKEHFVLDVYDCVYSFCNWDGKLDPKPLPHVFPLRIIQGRPDSYPDSYCNATEMDPQSPAVETPLVPSASPTPAAGTTTVPANFPEILPQGNDAPAVPALPKAIPQPPLHPDPEPKEVETPEPVAPAPAAVLAKSAPPKPVQKGKPQGEGEDQYSDGSYWKRLSL